MTQAVAMGLTRCLARALKYGPSPDELTLTVSVWCDDLTAAGVAGNPQRVLAVIEEIGREAIEWPKPAEVIARLRELQRRDRIALESKPSQETGTLSKAEAKARLAAVIDLARRRTRAPG